MPAAKTIFEHHDGVVEVQSTPAGNHIKCKPKAGVVCPRRECVTAYPLDIIEQALAIKGVSDVCDELLREEDPAYIEQSFRWDLLSFVAPEDFAGTRILDFGSGSGSSSLTLARMFPDVSEIIGTDLSERFINFARRRSQFRGLSHKMTFQASPDPNQLPATLGLFDFVILSAVFEHLLPAERTTVMPLVWRHVKPGGILFLDQTPNRWFPVEHHTTNLPLLNYLPDALAWRYAHLSPSTPKGTTWQTMLRRGIRGGTVGEIMSLLGSDAELLRPSRLGCNDHVDLWYKLSAGARDMAVKKAMKLVFKAIEGLTGVLTVPYISLAIRRRGESSPANASVQ